MKKNKRKTLSICVPVFNRIMLLERLIQSINCKNPRSIEVVIIDDGSSDDIKGLINLYKKKQKKITYRYFRQKNAGVAHAMLSAYRKSKGIYCIKMDTDDIFSLNGLDKILMTLEKKKSFIAKRKKICGIVFGTKLIFKERKVINSLPNNKITNFLELKADFKVNYDCKEVVLKKVILEKQIPISKKNRVVQQSWFNIANSYDCMTSKFLVAQKEYLEDGLSFNSGIIYKINEAATLAKINSTIAKSDRYKSKLFKYKSELLTQKYLLHSRQVIIKNIRNLFFLLLALPLFLYEKNLYKKVINK